MIISCNIFFLSILIFSKFSNLTQVNSSGESDVENIFTKPNVSLSGPETNFIIEQTSSDNGTESSSNKDVSNNMSFKSVSDSEHPNIPDLNLSESSNDSKIIKQDANGYDSTNSTSSSSDQLHLENNTERYVKNEEMPTFDEFRQKFEQESKQKREKSDSIPSSPTMIVKDNNIVRTGTDSTISQSANREQMDSLGSSSLPLSEDKSQMNGEKNIDSTKSGQNPVIVDKNQKSDFKISATLTTKLLKNNVAAKECGAKMLAFSRQITNADYVLNNNKDEYLNVPCSTSEKWFIVETCEPVQIRSIQIANFELFSSRPKTFKAYASDRYPVKYWYNLGLFRALDEKGIQTFSISDSNMVKYIKFEMVDHYGNEHYCPLTFVRVLGNVVIDEIDEEVDESQQPIDEDLTPMDNVEHKIESDGLLTKAKDILVKMVNGIGGTKINDLDRTIEEKNVTNTENTHEDIKSNLTISESPCYFIDFLIKEIQLNCDIFLSHFSHLLDLERFLTIDNRWTIENLILSLPFPSQIRAIYFSISQSIVNTNFQFCKLHHSFINLTLHFSQDICLQRPWQNLSYIFKCNLSSNQLSRFHEPSLPNITIDFVHNHQPQDHKDPFDIKSHDLNIPVVKTTEQNFFEAPKISNSGNSPSQQQEPVVVSNSKSSTTSGLPSLSNVTMNDEESSTSLDKDSIALETTSTISLEAININKETDKSVTSTSDSIKDSELDNIDSMMQDSQLKQNPSKSPSSKSTDEMILDQKFLATTPGNNAWNQAFMRIKNMAKQLEVNVSISMKYLEELSQNYKQQTERLKKAQQLMAENVSNLENMMQQYRQETESVLQDFNSKLRALMLKIKFGYTTINRMKSPHASTGPSSPTASSSSSTPSSASSSTSSSNLSNMLDSNEEKCEFLLSEEQFLSFSSTQSSTLWWWLESPWCMVAINMLLSLMCNVIFFLFLHNRLIKMKTDESRIINEKKKNNNIESSSTNFCAMIDYGDVENLTIKSTTPSRSLIDLRNGNKISPHPVVLPPRGVNMSFVNSEYFSDDDCRKGFRFHSELGPHFYAVQPNLKFVTPTKDRKKKRKK